MILLSCDACSHLRSVVARGAVGTLQCALAQDKQGVARLQTIYSPMAKTNATKEEAAMSKSAHSRNPVINAASLFRPNMSDAQSRWATDFIQEMGVRRLLPSVASPSFANHEFDIVLCAELPSSRQTFWRGAIGERKPKPIAIFRVCAEDTDADHRQPFGAIYKYNQLNLVGGWVTPSLISTKSTQHPFLRS